MKKIKLVLLLLSLVLLHADPCGMVPPISAGNGLTIKRIGVQKTYVFYKNGIETIVIRPGFSGKVDEFGMLIPFPSPPSLRKVPDDTFAHIAASIDPPEVVLDLSPRKYKVLRKSSMRERSSLTVNTPNSSVRIIKQEAVGMYEVTVLEAGSATALKKWMDEHGYRYPNGMDKVCNDYIKLKWCFVAVKTRVGEQQGVAPRPGMRKVNSKLTPGSSFDGHVQGMGFRFYTKEMVVPMRLSTFNGNDYHNIVYILADKPLKIFPINSRLIKRQISGEELYKNLTELLPLRVIGDADNDYAQQRIAALKNKRNPVPKNGLAAELYASDLLAASNNKLSHKHEENEKVLLNISENLSLRGKNIDKLHSDFTSKEQKKIVELALQKIKTMTLTVVDGNFPKKAIAHHNLTFREYSMPSHRNKPDQSKKRGQLYIPATKNTIKKSSIFHIWTLLGGLLLFVLYKKLPRAALCLLFVYISIIPTQIYAESNDRVYELVQKLDSPQHSTSALNKLVNLGQKAVPHLLGEAVEGSNIARRGWAIVGLSRIGGGTIDAHFQNIHQNTSQPMLVRTWALAGRIQMTQSLDELVNIASLMSQFPAINRPISQRITILLERENKISAESLLSIVSRIPNLRSVLHSTIVGLGAENLAQVMATAKDQQVRRLATGYIGSMAQSDNKVPYKVAKVYSFSKDATQVPWANGPLFVPGLRWDHESAQTLVGNLISWHLWCERMEKKQEQRQIHNNIRSLQLARAGGYQSPGWSEIGTDKWLLIWGKTVGKKELLRMLKEQGVHQQQRYLQILAQVPNK
ncbi:DUF2330 domain-containing protein [Candidatus Uabimicrobium sp. HlEnr_7]|uniref:DUF2330 domain-containing protein n=1 Tax=Candidatus Uabimicrobium helgolandensis TaxID=3095367 RepID=UPI00355788D8